jgi:dipeptidyl aminopeptidase/acylaminoacyl peptidase
VRLLAPALCLCSALLATAGAELPPLIPRQVLFGNPERALPTISPNGAYLAYLRPDTADVMQVWVRSIDGTDDRPITRDPKRGIWNYGWTFSGHDLFYLQDSDGDENFHVFLTNLETGETRDLTPIRGIAAAPLALEPGKPDEMLVTMNRHDPALMEPWRVDLKTGALTQLAENPGDVRNWLADADLAIRGAVAGRPDGGEEFRVRDTAEAPWRLAKTTAPGDQFQLVEFLKDGRTVIVQTNVESDTRGLYALDVATGAMKLLAADPGSDVAQVVVEPNTRAVQAVSFDRLRATWKFLDPSIASDWDALAGIAPGDLNLTSRDLADRTWIVAFNGDVSGTRFFVWDRASRKASFLFDAMPALASYTLAPVKPFELRSRDGLSLPSQLTLPAGVPAKGLPMMLLVHGGPWWRDAWGYDPEAQWLANRGFAVLQINYRGSAGFGKAFVLAARHESAGKMHDDLIDGVNWAIAEGIADPKRIGIMGASYGGYATLVGLSFTPEVFACGVEMVGPSNLVTLVESFPEYWKPFLSARWYPLVGNPADPTDRADMLARSPITRADRIRAPLLVAQGANDPRVKQAESDAIVAALRGRGVDVEYLVFPDEGHGLQRPENRLTFYTAAEAFLAKHLGGRAETQ